MLLERIGLTILIVTAGLAAYYGWSRLRLLRQVRRGLKLPTYRAGRPAIVYFTAPGCVPCRTIQRPALAALVQRYGDGVQVIEVDALVSPDLADHWGVLSVPTTFIVDSGGQPRCVNHGAVRLPKLERQLDNLGELPEARPGETSAQDYAVTEYSRRR